MKNQVYILLMILLFINISAIAQEDKTSLFAEYTIYANTESPRVLNGILEINKSDIYYATFFNQTKTREIIQNDDSKIIQIGSKAQIIHTKKGDSILTSTKKHRGVNYKITEKSPKLNWEILNENKKISNYNCTKALTTFRGRKYIAWYTEEIPSPFGPYKFSGLPGLILEIYDETDRFHWIINKIKFPFPSEIIKKELNDESKKYKHLSLKEFVEKNEKLKSNVESKLPRDISVSVEYKTSRNGIEIKYEWEEQTKED